MKRTTSRMFLMLVLVAVGSVCSATSGPDAATDTSNLDALPDTVRPDALPTDIIRQDAPIDSVDEDSRATSCSDAAVIPLSCDPCRESSIPVGWIAPCDASSRNACTNWAQQNAGSMNATALCSMLAAPRDGGMDSKCMRADHLDPLDFSHFLCGCGPACSPGAVCVSHRPGETPHCRCI